MTHTENGVTTLQAPTWGRGDWMQTFTGKKFYPMSPQAEDIDPFDIAHGISMQCRYNGHVKRFYSVAEHCVLMSKALEADRDLALWALLHDATESYVGDMVRPLKKHIPLFTEIEDTVMVVIAQRFGLASAEMPAEVKDADNRILLDERAALLGKPPAEWDVPFEPLGVKIQAWSPKEAEYQYLRQLDYLTEENLFA